jgi:peptidoglycan/LPS O-acetylase OafA/YrhL
MTSGQTDHDMISVVESNKVQPVQNDKVKISKKSYLDGLRGIVSFIVFIRHYSLPWQETMNEGYGQGTNRALFQLPILRVIYSGPTAAIFFVISGYVCSYKPLKLIRSQSPDVLLYTVSSAILRRGIRLFLPPMVSTLAVMIFVRIHLYNFDYDTMPGVVSNPPTYHATLWLQIQDWVRFVLVDLTYIWTWGVRSFDYDIHLYTIPIQFRTSMILFVTIIGLARTRTLVRFSILAFLFSYCMWVGRWEVALYFGGMLLAEYNLAQLERSSISLRGKKGSSSATKTVSMASKVFWSCCFFGGLYLGSFPRVLGAAQKTPGFIWLSHLTPNPRYWQTYAAILLVWSLDNAKFLQPMFISSYAQYLGKISFSIYIVHGPVLHVFGYAIVPAMWKIMGNDISFQYQLGFFLGLLVLSPIVLLIADIFYRLIDVPCAKLAMWVESKLIM